MTTFPLCNFQCHTFFRLCHHKHKAKRESNFKGIKKKRRKNFRPCLLLGLPGFTNEDDLHTFWWKPLATLQVFNISTQTQMKVVHSSGNFFSRI